MDSLGPLTELTDLVVALKNEIKELRLQVGLDIRRRTQRITAILVGSSLVAFSVLATGVLINRRLALRACDNVNQLGVAIQRFLMDFREVPGEKRRTTFDQAIARIEDARCHGD